MLRRLDRFDLLETTQVQALSLQVMAVRQLTEFEQVLLGMIAGEPSTGYHLKQEFATTPLGIYQPSSGALYPALRRLERRGLLCAGPTAARVGPGADTSTT